MTTPKEELHNLMVEVFMMIENMDTPEGDYIKIAEMFKQMNVNIDRLVEIKQTLGNNRYYRDYIRNQPINRIRLTEEQKKNHPDYILCNCGRYIKATEQRTHNKTGVHIQGLRNRKYAEKERTDDKINFCIDREVGLHAFVIRHIGRVKNEY